MEHLMAERPAALNLPLCRLPVVSAGLKTRIDKRLEVADRMSLVVLSDLTHLQVPEEREENLTYHM